VRVVSPAQLRRAGVGDELEVRRTIPDGHAFLLGDNLRESRDSRRLGNMLLPRCVPRVAFRISGAWLGARAGAAEAPPGVP
jgi:hypothetical protein